MQSEARHGVSTPTARADCGVPSGVSEFGDVAGAAARGWAGWILQAAAAAGHDMLLLPPDADVELIPQLEFDQTLGL